MKKLKPIPVFTSEAEERQFWEVQRTIASIISTDRKPSVCRFPILPQLRQQFIELIEVTEKQRQLAALAIGLHLHPQPQALR